MKQLLLNITIVVFSSISILGNAQQIKTNSISAEIKKIENSFDGKIGIYAINTNNNQVIAYREDERFPIQSTMKLIGVAALMKKSETHKNLLQQKIQYTQKDLMFWHPITGKYLKDGITLESLAEAAMTYSDNPAINLIMQQLGGPTAITNFAHSIGNKTFNISHYEAELNSNPGNSEDTSTPKDMAISLRKLTLGDVLAPSQREQLITWMKNTTTGYKRIRAGVPIGWAVADKTGSGDYGIANDIGILWSPFCKPIVLAIYTVQNKQDAKSRDNIVASATTIILDEFAKNDGCFAELYN